MKKADDDGKDEACGRDHQDVDEDEEDQLDQCPHVHLPQRPHLDVGPLRILGRIRDDKPDALPKLVSVEVGPSAVEKETPEHRHWNACEQRSKEDQGKEDEEMDHEGGDALLKAASDFRAHRQRQVLDGR